MKKTIKYSILGLAALCTVVLCGGYYMLGHALKPEGLITRSRNIAESYNFMFEQYPELQPWVDSLVTVGALKDFYIENDHGETLHALYVAATHPTPKTAVIVHGYTDNAVRMLMIGYLYNKEMDYQHLAARPQRARDERGQAMHRWAGKTGLTYCNGPNTADELFGRRHTDSVASRSTEMVVHGISMGAATTMMVSGEVEHGQYQQPFVKCFVEDCGYTSVWDEFSRRTESTVQPARLPSSAYQQAGSAGKSTDGTSWKPLLWSK